MRTDTIRPAAVAGSFYPGAAATLRQTLSSLLAGAGAAHVGVPKALIVPHAGYIYSGPVAAHAYARLSAARDSIRRVVLLGPAHRVAVRGLARPGPQVHAFATPLGDVALDMEALSALGSLPQVVTSDAAHAMEHSLEVQLPFLQRVLERFKLVPLAVGDATAGQVAEVLDLLWGGDETLIVVSSDLSHFLDYAAARDIDNNTAGRILALDACINHEQACGGTPINGLLLSAKQRGLEPSLLDMRNSGDTAGPKNRVVGYASFAFHQHAAV